MPSFTRIVAVLGTIAAVAAAPQARDNMVKRQSHPVDFEEACRLHRPEEGQLGFTTSGGVTVVWDGGNLGNGASSKLIALHDHDCNILDIREAEPQTPGFSTTFGVAAWSDDLDTVHAGEGVGNSLINVQLNIRQNWISDSLISEGAVRLAGVLIDRWCESEQSGMDGINMGYWRTCNFWPTHQFTKEG